MDPKKIIGCSQPYDIDELVVPLGDAQVCNISEFFGTAGEMIGRLQLMIGKQSDCFQTIIYSVRS